jgi:tRNA-dihydrouridine synthase
MQDVSVLPLWRCLERRGGPDIYVTEYLRVHRDSHPEKWILRSIRDLETEKPIMAQMIGNDPEHLVRTAKEIQRLVPCAGIDINLGCPAPTVCGKQAGGALLRNHELIRRIAVELRPIVQGRLTIKTRIGFETPAEFDSLLELFATLPLDSLAIHGRTVRERYQSDVHTAEIARAVAALPFPVFANGSIVSVASARAMLRKSGAAGLMIGRGAIRDPWLFDGIRDDLAGREPQRRRLHEVLAYLRELTGEVIRDGNFEKESQIVNRMKKFTNYIASGISGGTLNDELRRATSLAGYDESCRRHLESDDFFAEEPGEDGTLFCGITELGRSA